jgi:hypothetical protein
LVGDETMTGEAVPERLMRLGLERASLSMVRRPESLVGRGVVLVGSWLSGV